MYHTREQGWTRLMLVVCVVSVIVLGACALGTASRTISSTPVVPTTAQGNAEAPLTVRTVRRDFVVWQWAYGACANDTPPSDAAPPADEALVGQQMWGSGGTAGYECQTTVRTFMAGVFFAPEQLGTLEPAHATLQFHLDPLTQPNDCVVQLELATPSWESEDPSQRLAAPYAIVPLGTTAGEQQSLPSVTIDRQTQMVTVDVTSAAQNWITKQPPIDGLVFKTPYGCDLIHLTQLRLILDHTVLGAS